MSRSILVTLVQALNIVYLVLWAIYFLAMFLFYWGIYPNAALAIKWYRETFGILGFNFEAVPVGGDVTGSRVTTFLDWVGRTIWRDLVSLSLASSILFVIQMGRRKKSADRSSSQL